MRAAQVVVVVEAQRAHEELELPLLNRFEKQLFTPRHALTALQERLCATQLTYLLNYLLTC